MIVHFIFPLERQVLFKQWILTFTFLQCTPMCITHIPTLAVKIWKSSNCHIDLRHLSRTPSFGARMHFSANFLVGKGARMNSKGNLQTFWFISCASITKLMPDWYPFWISGYRKVGNNFVLYFRIRRQERSWIKPDNQSLSLSYPPSSMITLWKGNNFYSV